MTFLFDIAPFLRLAHDHPYLVLFTLCLAAFLIYLLAALIRRKHL